MIKILRADISDLELVKATRLESLRESPDTFTSSLEIEQEFTNEQWLERMARSQYFLALDGETPVGIACCIEQDEYPNNKRKLVSMWIDPNYRNQNLGSDLIDDAINWAKENDISEIELDVFEKNLGAKKLYEKKGFVMTRDNNTFEGYPGFYHTYVLKV